MANTYLTRAFSSSSITTKATISMWVKRTGISNTQMLFQTRDNSSNSNYRTYIRLGSSNTLDFIAYNSTGTLIAEYYTTRLLRDTHSWYHICYSIDTTLGTASDRVKLYINGVRETNFDTGYLTNPSQNELIKTTSSVYTDISRNGGNNANYFDGSMSHIHFIDGTAYDASAFGETDATTGEWKGKTSPSVTYGTNGFFILKDGNGITDQSGEGNNFTLGGGTLTDLKDNPDNVFATLNPLDNYYPAMTLSYGNTRALTIAGKYTYIPTTLGMTSGKYYAEIKCTAQSSSQNEFLIGITSTSSGSTTEELGHYANDYGYNGVAGNYRNNDGNTSYGASFTTGDIIGIAVDLDNNKLYFSKNGTFQNSGNPASGSTGTGAISITDPTLTSRGAYFFAVGYYSSSIIGTFDANFGNGYFGTTAITTNSGNGYSGAEGSSKFNYTVPTGYSALTTKGLNE